MDRGPRTFGIAEAKEGPAPGTANISVYSLLYVNGFQRQILSIENTLNSLLSIIYSNKITSDKMTTTEKSKPAGPFRLVTVNSSPERAKKLCGRLCEEMRGTHHIDYVANTTSKHTRY